MILNLTRPSLLAYPPGLAAFDRSHLAAKGVLLSAVPTGLQGALSQGSFINLITGKAGGVQGGPSQHMDGHMGPSILTTLGDYISFSGNAATNYTTETIAIMTRATTSFSGFQFMFSNGSNNAGSELLTNNGLIGFNMWGVVTLNSTITMVSGSPYFIVASRNGTTIVNYVAVNLNTGKIETSTSAGGTPNAPDGNWVVGIGSSLGAGTSWAGQIAAVMYSNNYLTMPELLKWARDPWSFWYPRGSQDLIYMLNAPVVVAGPSVVSSPQLGRAKLRRGPMQVMPFTAALPVPAVPAVGAGTLPFMGVG